MCPALTELVYQNYITILAYGLVLVLLFGKDLPLIARWMAKTYFRFGHILFKRK